MSLLQKLCHGCVKSRMRTSSIMDALIVNVKYGGKDQQQALGLLRCHWADC